MTILKQLAGWVIALERRFRKNDIFFSTRTKIIASLVVFVAAIAAGFILLIEHVKRILMTGMIESLLLTVSSGVNDPSIIAESSSAAERATYTTIFIIIVLALISGIVVSRLALAPIRQSFQMQKQFISGIAHELRTPLSILRMNNEVARFNEDYLLEVKELLEENIADIDRINEILNNLLLFDRMVSTETLQFQALDLRQIAHDVSQRLEEFAGQKRISISITSTHIPEVLGNRTAIEQALFNIIKNAVAYTPHGGKVTITYGGSSTHSVSLHILDSGFGIPPKDLPHIFEPFYRSDKTGKLSGTGIGLAIVFEIIKLHRGTIEVESMEGKGTSFLLTLPIYHQNALTAPEHSSTSKVSYSFSKDKTRS